MIGAEKFVRAGGNRKGMRKEEKGSRQTTADLTCIYLSMHSVENRYSTLHSSIQPNIGTFPLDLSPLVR